MPTAAETVHAPDGAEVELGQGSSPGGLSMGAGPALPVACAQDCCSQDCHCSLQGRRQTALPVRLGSGFAEGSAPLAFAVCHRDRPLTAQEKDNTSHLHVSLWR